MLALDPRFERIDAMVGRDFEAAVAELLEMLGYEDVECTSFYDKGADILALKNGARIAVQVKRWARPVDQKSVLQLVNGVKQYECDRGLLVTNSFLTEPAERTAKTWGIEIWDRRTLAELLRACRPRPTPADAPSAVPGLRRASSSGASRTRRGTADSSTAGSTGPGRGDELAEQS